MTNWRDVALDIQNTLPTPLNKRRCGLLPKILSEWDRTELVKYRAYETRAQLKAKIKKTKTVKKAALQLLSALKDLDEDGLADIVFQIVIGERGGPNKPVNLGQAEFVARMDRLHQETEFLAKLGAISPDKYWLLTPGQRVISAYWILRDAASIYEWLTGKKASRTLDTASHFEISPFYDFAEPLWLAIFGSKAGLPNALKRWAEGRNRFGEGSALVANIAMRRPEWGIFEP